MKQLLITLALVTSFIFISSSPILADNEVRNLVLDTQAKGFTQDSWSNDLSSSNIIFAPNDKFQVRVKLKNLGNRNQTNIRIVATTPNTVTIDVPDFTINQVTPGQEFYKDVVVYIKDSQYIFKQIKPSTIKFHMTTDVGTVGDDSVTFYTSNGTKVIAPTATPTATSTLPVTGPAANMFFGSILAILTGYGALKLRNYARGY